MATNRVADKQEALALIAAGWRQRDVAARVGVSRSTLQRWLHPEYDERSRIWSREAKRRRRDQHPCADCGTPCWPTATRCPDCARALDQTRITREECLAALRRHRDPDGGAPKLRTWWDKHWSPSAQTIINRFGSWTAACREAGYTPRRSGGQPRRRTHA